MIFVKGYREEILNYVIDNQELLKKMRNKSCVITGAAGLIGSYIVDILTVANEQLSLNCVVHAVDINETLMNSRFPKECSETVKCHYADVNDDMLENMEVDFLIHAASNTSPADYATKPIATMRTNIIGTDKLLGYCVRNKVKRFVFCSSVEAYGRNNGDVDDFNEDYSGYLNSNTLRAGYPSAKRAAEALCNAYYEENKGLEFVIARIGRIYGPTIIDGDTKAPSQFIKNAVRGENIMMKSNGLQEFSYAYVGDCAIAILYIMLQGKNAEAYNVADSKSKILLRDFAKYSALAGGTEVEFCEPTSIERQGYSKITKATMSVDKLESLGWSAKYDVQEGVKRTVEYLKQMKGIV